MALAKARVEAHLVPARRGDVARRIEARAEIARDEEVEFLRREAPRERARLCNARRGERAVALSLDARRDVPLGLAVGG